MGCICSGETLERVAAAERAVAAEGEDARGLRSMGQGNGEDHGGEAGVRQDVKVAGCAVEVQERTGVEVLDHFEGEFRVLEESGEDVESSKVDFEAGRGWVIVVS